MPVAGKRKQLTGKLQLKENCQNEGYYPGRKGSGLCPFGMQHI